MIEKNSRREDLSDYLPEAVLFGRDAGREAFEHDLQWRWRAPEETFHGAAWQLTPTGLRPVIGMGVASG
uniref:hypothetical protein n=1 Tax=Pseudomonas laurentiana TaxID=2364649 RepID=UPI0029C81B36|nr:hypothetical protein [Pseudomonas laurentiana]